jgi:hypothetical protein
MGVGPVFEHPKNFDSRFTALVRLNKIRVQIREDPKPRFIFRRGISRIIGHRYQVGHASKVYLAFPREHAFNPLFWLSDFHLLHRIEKLLLEFGAVRSDL